jgi:hypothetical protein
VPHVVRTVAASAFLLASLAPAFADQPGADWLTIEQVTQRLKEAGYTQVNELEADDGHWEGEGMKDGQMIDFHVDPHTGEFTKEEVDQ